MTGLRQIIMQNEKGSVLDGGVQEHLESTHFTVLEK